MFQRRMSLIMLLLALGFEGCGYSLLTSLPVADCRTVYLAPLFEEGEDMGLALPWREALSRQLVARGITVAATVQSAECVLQARVTKLATSLGDTSYGDQEANSYVENARGYCLLEGKDGRRHFHSGNIALSETFLASQNMNSSQVEILASESSRRRILETMAQKMAEECLERMEDQWLQPPSSQN